MWSSLWAAVGKPQEMSTCGFQNESAQDRTETWLKYKIAKESTQHLTGCCKLLCFYLQMHEHHQKLNHNSLWLACIVSTWACEDSTVIALDSLA